MNIAIASDHGGYALKRELMPYLEKLGYKLNDLGCENESSCDYPDFGIALAKAVANGEFERGILICGTGIGISISANKVKGIRCALCTDATMARLTREHNDANVLALGGRIVGAEHAKDIAATFLSTAFSGEERHQKRIDKISKYESGL